MSDSTRDFAFGDGREEQYDLVRLMSEAHQALAAAGGALVAVREGETPMASLRASAEELRMIAARIYATHRRDGDDMVLVADGFRVIASALESLNAKFKELSGER